MLEGVQPFHPKNPEEAVKLMCLEKKRLPFKIKVRSASVHFGEKICQMETRACWFFKSPDGKVINADSIYIL